MADNATIQHDDRLTVSVDEACRLTSIGRSTLYELMYGGHIHYAKVGRRRLINVQSLRRLLGVESARAA